MQVKVKSAVHINRPPQEVFDYLSNPDNMPVWQSTLHHVEEKRNLAGARLARNAVVHDRRNVLGKDIDSQYQVAAFEEGKSLTLQVAPGGPVSFQMTWDLQPLDGGTYLTAEGGGDLGDLPMSPVAANRGCQLLLESDLKTLTQVLEGQAKGR